MATSLPQGQALSKSFSFMFDFIKKNFSQHIQSSVSESKILLSHDGYLTRDIEETIVEAIGQDEDELILNLFLEGAVVSSFSETMTNVDLKLFDLEQKLDVAEEGIKEVEPYLEKSNIWLIEANKKLKQLKSFKSSFCIRKGKEKRLNKRFLVSLGIAIFSLVSVVALSSAATVATLAATGQLDSAQIEKEQLIISEQRVEDEKQEQEFFLNNELQNQNQTKANSEMISKLINTRRAENKLKALEHDMDILQQGLWTMIDPYKYTFEESPVLTQAIKILSNGTALKDLDKFGLNDVTRLLQLSTTKTFVVKNEREQMCHTTDLRTSFRTYHPNLEKIGLPTENPFKFQVEKHLFMWINPKSFLLTTKFRPTQSISSQRTILTDQNIQVNPVNNTFFLLKSNGRFNVSIFCPDDNRTIELYPHPILRLRLDCQLVSRSLNISSYELRTFKGNLNTWSDKDTDLDDLDKFVAYHPDAQGEIDEKEAQKLIETVHKDGNLWNQKEKEKLENKKNIFSGLWTKITGWIEDQIDTLIAAGIVVIGFIAVGIVVVCSCNMCRCVK